MALFAGKDVTKKPYEVIFYDIIFILRRVLLAYLIFFVEDTGMQIIAMMLANLFQSIYLLHFKPFESRKSNMIELFNESLIVVLTMLMVCFTDIVGPPEPKEDIGWLVIALFFASLLINIVWIVQ